MNSTRMMNQPGRTLRDPTDPHQLPAITHVLFRREWPVSLPQSEDPNSLLFMVDQACPSRFAVSLTAIRLARSPHGCAGHRCDRRCWTHDSSRRNAADRLSAPCRWVWVVADLSEEEREPTRRRGTTLCDSAAWPGIASLRTAGTTVPQLPGGKRCGCAMQDLSWLALPGCVDALWMPGRASWGHWTPAVLPGGAGR